MRDVARLRHVRPENGAASGSPCNVDFPSRRTAARAMGVLGAGVKESPLAQPTTAGCREDATRSRRRTGSPFFSGYVAHVPDVSTLLCVEVLFSSPAGPGPMVERVEGAIETVLQEVPVSGLGCSSSRLKGAVK